jgi:reductive dehalogenase
MSDETQEENQEKEEQIDDSRRKFFKVGLAGAGVAAVAAGGAFVLNRMEGKELDDLPNPIDKKLFKPFSQKNAVLTRAAAGFDPELHEMVQGFEHQPYRNAPGYTQLDRALADGGWAVSQYMAPWQQMGQSNVGALTWEQHHLVDHKYEFESKQAASQAMKNAAKLYGATVVGIARNDPRFNYDPMYDVKRKKTLTWDDFPFKPKSVIVIACEMNYENMATAPAWTESGTVAMGYSDCVKTVYALAVFIQSLGYRAVPSVNGEGINPAYAIMAGLGEGARNGEVIIPHYGPRHRLAKVYTDLDFFEYDKPRDYHVMSFCRNCKKCAMACPSNAITMDDEPSYHPTFSKNPDDWFKNHIGVLKFYSDSEKCFRFWLKNDGDCGICIASCPYNKPSFWHHRLVDAQNVLSPGPVHYIMRIFDDLFGYGKVGDPAKVKKWWKHGPPKGKLYGPKT